MSAHTPMPRYRIGRRRDTNGAEYGPTYIMERDDFGTEQTVRPLDGGFALVRAANAAAALAEALRALTNNAARHTDAVHIVPSHVIERARAALTAAGIE